MTVADIIIAANTEGFSSRFRKWLAWILKWEVSTDSQGNIQPEDLHDGAGVTFGGLTERDDGLTHDPTPQWESMTYRERYWIPAHAETMPGGVGEVVANFAVNTGLEHAASFLQAALVDYGQPVKIDGKIGPLTVASTWKVPFPKDLARAVVAKGGRYYQNQNQPQWIRGWLNRNADLIRVYCDV